MKGSFNMPLPNNIKIVVYDYCRSDLANDSWYLSEFEFIEDIALKTRIIEEFKAIRFAYKLYEGIAAIDENLIFEVRHQIFAYASIYEAVLHYVLYTYYDQTAEFHDLQYHIAPAKISIPNDKLFKLNNELTHNGESIIPYHLQERRKDESQVRFDDKCKTAEQLGLIHSFINKEHEEVSLTDEIIEIYSYRNAIHLIAEQRKGIDYELELSKRAYRRMRPFIDQIKFKLREDKKGIYAE